MSGNESVSFTAAAHALEKALDAALPRLLAIDEDGSLSIRAGGAWTRREILGHLVDSAANNHQRFVRGQIQERLSFPGYTQDEWVALQAYRYEPWARLVPLWEALNRHLVHVVARMPESAAARQCSIGDGAPVTLAFIAQDYVRHLEHHLEQILEPEAAQSRRHAAFQDPR